MPNSTVRYQNGQNGDPTLNGNNLRRTAFFWPQVLCMVMIFLGLKSLPAEADQPLMAAYLQQSDITDSAHTEGALILQNASGEAFQAPLLTTDAKIEISGLTARIVLTQTFLNRSNDWMSGRYQFPLPEQAAVHHMVMLVGERRIVGRVREKGTAKKIFDAAQRAGKRASLVSQQRPNMFTSRVANIAPGESVSVEIH